MILSKISQIMAMNPTWLGIDPGLAIVGWAFLEEVREGDARLLDYGTVETNKELTTPERLLEIEQDMVELISELATNLRRDKKGVSSQMSIAN